MAAQEGVRDVHDLHIWALSTTRAALAVHLVWQGEDRDAVLDDVAHRLAERFGISENSWRAISNDRLPCSARLVAFCRER